MAQDGQTHYKDFTAFATRLLKCVWPFWDMHESNWWRVKVEIHLFVVFFYIEILHLEYFISKLVLTRSETLAL